MGNSTKVAIKHHHKNEMMYRSRPVSRFYNSMWVASLSCNQEHNAKQILDRSSFIMSGNNTGTGSPVQTTMDAVVAAWESTVHKIRQCKKEAQAQLEELAGLGVSL